MALDNITFVNYTDKETIKNWFKTGLKPTQAQFWSTWDSFWHKSESLPISSISGLGNLLDGKAKENHEHAQYATNDATSLTLANVTDWQKKLGVDNLDYVKIPTEDATDNSHPYVVVTNEAGESAKRGLESFDKKIGVFYFSEGEEDEDYYPSNLGTAHRKAQPHMYLPLGDFAVDLGLSYHEGEEIERTGCAQQQGTISGGYNNTITANGDTSTISGGYLNLIDGGGGNVINGGYRNEIKGTIYKGTLQHQFNVIGGGYQNKILQEPTGSNPSRNMTISGGGQNTVSARYATIGGGFLNTSTGEISTIIGGQSNNAIGYCSSVIGGWSNTAQSYGEVVGGIFATTYTPASKTEFNANDRIFVIGVGKSSTDRQDGIVIYKSGLATLPTCTNALIESDTTGKAVVTKEYLNSKYIISTDSTYPTLAEFKTKYPNLKVGDAVFYPNLTDAVQKKIIYLGNNICVEEIINKLS